MASPMEASSLETERIKKELFNMAMRGEWDNVVSIYEKDHRVHHAKITRSGDTALHVVVSDCQEDVVRELVQQIVSKHPRDPGSVLGIQNDRGNTALHLAASMGNVHMCQSIAEVKPSLIGSRNEDGKTPLFLAALRGKKDAFLCLHYMCDHPDLAASYCRRNDGQTALHCAIEEEYFDLAFQIIYLYGDLFVNSFDENGLSPLHILASKPFAFKSGVNLLPWHKIIYNCTFVDPLEPADQLLQSNNLEGENKPTYPENYKDCVEVFQLLSNIVVRLCLSARNESNRDDSERPRTTFNQKGKPLSRGSQGHQLVPYNYTYCFSFVKILCKALLIILGYGSRMIKRIREIKEKHIWSVQIMNELLKYLSMYEDEKSGANPHTAPTDKDDSETKPHEIVDGREVTFPSYTIEWPIPHAIQRTGQLTNYKGKNGRGKDEKGKKH